MKTKLLFAVGLLLAFNSFGQEVPLTITRSKETEPEKKEEEKKEEEKETEENKNSKEINKTLKEIEKKIDGFTDKGDSIGYIHLFQLKIYTYDNTDQKKDPITIGTTSIEIRQGTIVSISVQTTSGTVYSNSRSFIELSEINNYRCDKLHTYGGNYIKTCDFLAYVGSRAFPSDTSYSFTEAGKKAVRIKTGLNNIFQARLYSDLLALAGDESNGLVQSEVSFKSNLHNRNIRNCTGYIFHYVYADFGLSRFDSKFRTVTASDSTNDDTLDVVDFMDIYQQSFVTSTIKINVFEWFVNRSYSSFSVNLLTGLNAARYRDSIDLPVRRINMPYYGGEILFHAKPFDNFGLVTSYSLKKMHFYGIENLPSAGDPKLTYCVNMEMYWNPSGKEANRIFARFRYTDMFGPSLPFSQFQVGYAVNFSEWAKAKE